MFINILLKKMEKIPSNVKTRKIKPKKKGEEKITKKKEKQIIFFRLLPKYKETKQIDDIEIKSNNLL